MGNTKHNLALKLAFLILGWGFHYLISRAQMSHLGLTLEGGLQPVWSFFTVSLALFTASSFQIFRDLRLFPRKSDPLVMGLVWITAEMIAQLILGSLSQLPSLGLWALVTRASVIVICWHLVHWALMVFMKASGYKLISAFVGEQKDLLSLKASIEGTEVGQLLDLEWINPQSEANKTFDLVIYGPSALDHEQMKYQLIQMTLVHQKVIDYRDVIEDIENHVDAKLRTEGDILRWAQQTSSQVKIYTRLKSILEPLAALILMILLAPLFLITAALVKVSSPGPILFRQKRLGLGGRTFEILKFRTMRVDAESNGAQWATQNDPRITRIGSILRTLHLDELPQLVNILRGELGFVGPRPERPEFYEKLKCVIPLFYLRTVIKPGVTGWAQVCAGYAATVEESDRKLAFDLYYMKNLSLRMDVVSVILTFVHVFRKFFLKEKALVTETETLETFESTASRSDWIRRAGFVFALVFALSVSVTSIAFGF